MGLEGPLHRRGSRRGAQGARAPPMEKMGSHNLPRTDEFLEGVGGGGGGGGVTWSLEKVKKKISKLYIIRIKTFLHIIF